MPNASGVYESVLTNDAYAVASPTMLITPEEPGGVDGTPPPPPYITECDLCSCTITDVATGQMWVIDICGDGGSGEEDENVWATCGGDDRVFVGHQQVTEQWDNWINIAGNGGGSEMRLSRVGVDKAVESNGQYIITQFSTTARMFIKRSEINNEEEEWWGILFDPGWRCEDGPQRFLGWEWDNANENELSGSLGMSAGQEINGTKLTESIGVQYKIKWTSKDDAIWEQTYERGEYIRTNRLDESCGTEAIPVGLHSLFDANAELAKRSCYHGYWTMPDVERY